MITYFDLLSSEPYEIEGICSIKPLTLKTIKKIGYKEYENAVSYFCLQKDDMISLFGIKKFYDEASDEDKELMTPFNLSLLYQKEVLEKYLSFFICEKLQFEKKSSTFLVYDIKDGKEIIIGEINNNNYRLVCDIILEFCYIHYSETQGVKKITKRAQKILDKINKYKKQLPKKKKDENYDMGNMISALSSYSNNLNILDIWNLTVYQLNDLFIRQTRKNQIDIHSMNYACWGGENSATDWCKNINNMIGDKNNG